LEETEKTEMKKVTDIYVFNRISDSEWAGDVRILTDSRKPNAHIKIKPFPLPKISDLLSKLSGFKYETAIHLSMGYH
jgi:hypothetical protein